MKEGVKEIRGVSFEASPRISSSKLSPTERDYIMVSRQLKSARHNIDRKDTTIGNLLIVIVILLGITFGTVAYAFDAVNNARSETQAIARTAAKTSAWYKSQLAGE